MKAWKESRATRIKSNKHPWINGLDETISRTKYFLLMSYQISWDILYSYTSGNVVFGDTSDWITILLFFFRLTVLSCAFSINDIKAGGQQHETQLESNIVFLK